MNTSAIVSRPREYLTLKASDLTAHPLNARKHPDSQKEALADSLNEFGDVRSVLAYRSPERFPGQIVLIDGHLRSSLDPERLLNVEVLTDLTDAEAEALLVTIDPLAQLATYDEAILSQLRDVQCAASQAVQGLWSKLDQASAEAQAKLLSIQDQAKESSGGTKGQKKPLQEVPEQFLVLIKCKNEAEQTGMFQRLRKEGIKCELKTS